MKAIQVKKTGGPEELTLVDLPIPTPKANEAVVKLSTAGVNFIDVYYREGRYATSVPLFQARKARALYRPSAVKFRKSNQEIVLRTRWFGSYAEYAAVPAEKSVRIPDGVDDENAIRSDVAGNDSSVPGP